MAGPGDVPGYERLGVISAAAGSTVLKARDLRTGRVCALKVMRTFEALDPERQARFEQEAQRLMALSHACVVRVWDVGVSGGTAWIAQELVEGPSLQELLDALGGPLPLEAALAVGVQLGSALVALSSADLAHLDISPANVLIAPDGVVKLCDFGLGFELGLSQRLAGVQLTIQTVDCVAPELVEGELVPDLRADAYGLGATLYCCLTGRPPFAESELEVRLQSIVHEAPPDLLEIDPGIPPQLASAVGWLMARDRDDRPLPQDVGPWPAWCSGSWPRRPTGPRPRPPWPRSCGCAGRAGRWSACWPPASSSTPAAPATPTCRSPTARSRAVTRGSCAPRTGCGSRTWAAPTARGSTAGE